MRQRLALPHPWAAPAAPPGPDGAQRDHEEARTLYELLQDQVIPTYYNRSQLGYSTDWVRIAKHSMATILPHFNAARMVGEYLDKFYGRAAAKGRRLGDGRFQEARALAEWKARVRLAWPKVALRRLDVPQSRISFGQSMQLEVAATLDRLDPRDVVVEVVFGHSGKDAGAGSQAARELLPDPTLIATGEHRYVPRLEPELCGKIDYRVRCYPTARAAQAAKCSPAARARPLGGG